MKESIENRDFHFYASSCATWRTTTPERDLRAMLKLMEAEGYPYNLFYVPLPYDAPYKIRFYQPVVDGLIFMGEYQPKKRK